MDIWGLVKCSCEKKKKKRGNLRTSLDQIFLTRYDMIAALVIGRNKFIETHTRIPGWSLHTPGSFCDKCGVTFTTQHALLRHITSRHEESQSSTAFCNICQRFFKTKWSLATHNSKYHRNC